MNLTLKDLLENHLIFGSILTQIIHFFKSMPKRLLTVKEILVSINHWVKIRKKEERSEISLRV